MTLTLEERRMIGLTAPILLRMLRAREERVINKIYGDFRSGKTDQLTALAELACVRDLTHEITTVAKQLETETQP